MNGYPPDRELPELSNEQIVLLDSICKAASQSTKAPFKALTAEYEAHFQERGLDSSRDNAILRWVMRVGDSARRQYRVGRPTDFVPYVRSLLESQGITVIDDDEEGEIDGVTRSLEAQPNSAQRDGATAEKRRVSFDDARLEETWLSERSQFPQSSPEAAPHTLLRQPPRRTADFRPAPRARSVSSSERHSVVRHPAPKHFQHASPSRSSANTSEHEEPKDPSLWFQPSQTRLEEDADTFWAHSIIRLTRKCLHIWHDTALVTLARRSEQYNIAADYDREHLLRPAFEAFHGLYRARRAEREQALDHQAHLEALCEQFTRDKSQRKLDETFSHWYHSAIYQRRVNTKARVEHLKKKFFRLWRKITLESETQARLRVSRKFLALWRDRTARKLLVYEQADAHYEETLMRKYFTQWYWQLWSRKVEVWRKERLQRRSLRIWQRRLAEQDLQEQGSQELRNRRLALSTLLKLQHESKQRRQSSISAEAHYGRKLTSGCIQELRVHARLAPLAATLSLKVTINLKRKCFKIWQLQLSLCRQAADVNRKRILQSAWTDWNDALRCKALAQRINERVLLENLYKWVLHTRENSFRRSQEQKLRRRTLVGWSNKVHQAERTLEQATADFEANQRQRRLRSGMLQLNIALRKREDLEREAVEFSNSRTIPDVLAVWKYRTEEVQKLSRQAARARFWVLGNRTLSIWHEKTTEHKHQRRREAYAQVRSKTKIRIVRTCLSRLQAKKAELDSIRADAEQRHQARLFKIGTQAFDSLREKAAQYTDLELRARATDQQRLLFSAFSALFNRHADLSAMEQQSLLMEQKSDLALLGSALKKVQWETFTAARRAKTADALWDRIRSQHIKLMLRHWAAKAASQKAAKSASAPQDPESPSIRPASRAASRSAERLAFTSSPPAQTATPGYMRTPSRSRKAGRFRPLSTPAHVTPMYFNRSFFATAPAPLASAQPAETRGEANEIFGSATPQITPFARKLRAGGVTPAPHSALRSSNLGRSVAGGGTSKSVRFAGSSRFGSGTGAGKSRLSPTDE
ncbi:Hypothetical predicted protein [Lecanosticta acicola]|uniref:Sfi1 spindle body domain-containing protein n=1 Tax=Lecanosticta acicola TaxID=111012 RepID=A0AAI8W112_9PEZI|nr:Hypothetical predicted protein [Lecanosticta acicola]